MDTTMTIKPIETEYDGHKFRSRLEARWAVFFDAAGIIYEYEPEGFEDEDKNRYLPDFYLPESQTYVEVKPQRPGYAKEIDKALNMISKQFDKLLILQDIPAKTCYDFYWYPVAYYHPVTQRCEFTRITFEPQHDCFGDLNGLTVCGWTYLTAKAWKAPDIAIACQGDEKCAREFAPIQDSMMPYECKEERFSECFTSEKDFLNDCYNEARQARFEYGETPKGDQE